MVARRHVASIGLLISLRVYHLPLENSASHAMRLFSYCTVPTMSPSVAFPAMRLGMQWSEAVLLDYTNIENVLMVLGHLDTWLHWPPHKHTGVSPTLAEKCLIYNGLVFIALYQVGPLGRLRLPSPHCSWARNSLSLFSSALGIQKIRTRCRGT